MHYILLSVFILLQTNWVVYESADPAFSVSFPSEIDKKEKIIKTDIGEILVKTVYAASSVDSTDNNLYLLNYYKLDKRVFEGDSAITIEEFFNATIDNIAKDLNAEVVYSNNNINDKISTAIYRLENDKTAMKGKIIISGGYFYSLQVFTSKQYSLNTNIDRFLNSFYLH